MIPSRLGRSISSEWRKVLATKLWWILALTLVGYAAMIAAAFAFIFSSTGDLAGAQPAPAASPQQSASVVYSSVATFAYVIPLLLGALAATGELRHHTLGVTFTFEPRRGIVLAAKTIVLLIFGLVMGVAGVIGSVGGGASVLVATDGDPMLGSGTTWAVAARVVCALAVWAVIGFGIGMLVRSQAIAIVLALVFTQFLEPILRTGAQVWDWSAEVAKFLPGAATDSFVGASAMTMTMSDAGMGGSDALGVTPGFFVLAAYAVALVAAGWLLRWRGDVS